MIGVGEDFPFDFAHISSLLGASPPCFAPAMHNTAEDGAMGGYEGESFSPTRWAPKTGDKLG